jgi:HEAT repeat protein
MGLFDLFKGKSKQVPEPSQGGDRNLARLGKIAGDKHAQNYDRIEAIEALAKIQNAESVTFLLKRFTFYIDPSITDQEEKDAALRGILGAGEAAILPIRTFCAKAESLTWPLKILKELVPSDRYVEEVVRLLEPFDTEYTRNVDPKQQLISELEHYNLPAIRPAVERFLEDASDDVRFATVATVFAQEDAASAGPLTRALVVEESVRVKNRLAEGLAARSWAIPEDLRNDARGALPQGFSVGSDGVVKKR